MNYVEYFNLLGVDAKQIPSITGEGAPTTSTEGAVGCLYMDTLTGDIYKCTAVNSGVYTWVLDGEPYFKKSNITNETGDSEDKVMSQKAVTDELNLLSYGKIEHAVNPINGVESSSTGEVSSSNTRLLIQCKLQSNGPIEIKVNGMKVFPHYWKKTDDGFAYVPQGGSWRTEDFVLTNPNFYFDFVVAKVDNSNIVPSECAVSITTKRFLTMEDGVTVVQTTGDSETAVMSQKAISDILLKGEGLTGVAYTVIDGKFRYVTGGSADGRTSDVNGASCTELIPVVVGEKYYISTNVGVNTPACVFYSQNNAVKENFVWATEKPTEYSEVENLEVIVPDGASYMSVNRRLNSSSPITILKLDAHYIENVHEEIEAAKTEITAEIEAKNYEIAQLERRVLKAEKNNDFAWKDFDKAYFVFVHDDSNAFVADACNAFANEGAPLSMATIASRLGSTVGDRTVKEWLDLLVANGGEVLAHYSGNLLNDTDDSVWYQKVVTSKRTLEAEGFAIRGLILADSSARGSEKGEKFCRKYYDYADGVGYSTQYALRRTLMLNYSTLDSFKAHIDTCAQTNGLYIFGFHGLRDDEAWITQESLQEIIRYIKSKGNTCEITTYSNVFDTLGTTALIKRIEALENQ